MKTFALVLAVQLLGRSVPSMAWHSCEFGGICPDGGKCCVSSSAFSGGGGSRSTCISGNNASFGSCCTDYDDGETGCGAGFECAYDNGINYYYCKKVDMDNESIPDKAPRYRLCTLPDEALKQVHGLPVVEESWKNKSSPQLAYLSTMGALDSGIPEILQRHAKVQSLVIMVHGSARNADDYLCTTNSALPVSERDPSTSSIMIIAPWFLADEDGPVTLYGKPENVKPIRWTLNGPIFHTWRYGADAVNLNNFSSYDAADAIVERILSDVVRFPSLKNIVVAGHSAGGQYTQRWALLSSSWAFSSLFDSPSSLSLSQRPVTLRVVVANPKSFCFLDERRFVNETFCVPPASATANCSEYNEWEWGLGEGNFLPTPYKDKAFEIAGGKDEIVLRYSKRNVIYLAGENDVIPNGECEAKLQGPYRRIRSKHFFESLHEIYGRQVHHRLVVSGVYHNHGLMFQSPEGYQAMFGVMETALDTAKRI